MKINTQVSNRRGYSPHAYPSLLRAGVTLLLLLCLSVAGWAQASDVIFKNTFAGSINAIIPSGDGGFIMVGGIGQNGGDFRVSKVNASGALIWHKTFGGSGNEAANAITPSADGGFVIAGYTYSNDGEVRGNHGGGDAWIIKLDGSGNLQWQKALGGSNFDVASSITSVADGSFVVAGSTESNDGDVAGNHGRRDAWAVKLDASGKLIWQIAAGGSFDDGASGVTSTEDGGFIVAGSADSNDGDLPGNQGRTDSFVFKLNSAGKIVWKKNLGGSRSDGALAITKSGDGGVVLAGFSESFDGDLSDRTGGGNYDYWVVKLDASGRIVWQTSVGDSANLDICYAITNSNDGGFVVTGGSDQYKSRGSSALTIKLDGTGGLIWKDYSTLGFYTSARAITASEDGGVVVTGYYQGGFDDGASGAFLLKLKDAATAPANCLALGDQCSGNASESKSYTINAATAGNQELKLSYLALEGPSTLQLIINGSLTTVALPQTPGDRSYQTISLGTYFLNGGNNSVVMASGGGYICFRELCKSETTTPPPPPPVPTPTTCLALGEQCSGNASESKSYTLNVAATGEKELLLNYFAQERPSTLQLIVNGKLTTVALPQTPYSRVYRTISLGTFLLNSGNNSVVMASGGGYICFLELCVNGSTPPPPPVPAPDGCFILGNQCTGNTSESVNHTFNQTSASKKALTVVYRALERPTSLQVTVNGTRRTVVLPQTSNDFAYGTMTMNLGTYALNAGSNTISLASEGGYACFQEFCISDPNSNTRLSAEEITLESAPLTTYPNPTTGNFEVSFYLAPGQRAALSVNDMLGRPVWTKALTGKGEHKEQIRLSEAANGMFTLRLQRENAEPGQATEFTKVLVVK